MALLLLVIISPHVDKAFDTQNVVTTILIGDHFPPADSNTLTSKVVTTWWYHQESSGDDPSENRTFAIFNSISQEDLDQLANEFD